MAWEVVSPKDGQLCGTKYVRDATEAEDPTLVFDTVPDGSVWDAASRKPRLVNDIEKLAAAKEAKVENLAACAIDDLAIMFTKNMGRDETALLLASHVLGICEALGIQPDPRLSELVTTGQKALAKKTEVEKAVTVDEVESVVW
jgi:hypothetical protein